MKCNVTYLTPLFDRSTITAYVIQLSPVPKIWARHITIMGSSVGIATGYGLDGPGIESQWGQDFPHLSRPAVGPTHSPIQWVLGLSRG